MSYIHYDTKVVETYQVKLIGWPHPTFVSPGEISTVSEIRCLRDVLKIGTCKWVRLTTRELNNHMMEYEKRCQAGEVVPKKRKERSDKGKKRKATSGNVSDGEGNERPKKKKKGSARDEVTSTRVLQKRKESSTSGGSHATGQLPPSVKQLRRLSVEEDSDSSGDE
jgi:hypothetical protein